MNITELREKRAKLWNTMEGFLDTHRIGMGVPHLVILRSSLFAVKTKMKNFVSYKTIKNRAVGIADTVQRGLGMLPNKQVCEN